MSKRLSLLLVALLLAGLALGCGGTVPPGINSGKDKPKPAEKEP